MTVLQAYHWPLHSTLHRLHLAKASCPALAPSCWRLAKRSLPFSLISSETLMASHDHEATRATQSERKTGKKAEDEIHLLKQSCPHLSCNVLVKSPWKCQLYRGVALGQHKLSETLPGGGAFLIEINI